MLITASLPAENWLIARFCPDGWLARAYSAKFVLALGGGSFALLAVGEIFTLTVYAQLLLENAEIYAIDRELVDQIFDVMVRDFSRFAVELHGKPTTRSAQAEYCLRMIRRPTKPCTASAAAGVTKTGTSWEPR